MAAWCDDADERDNVLEDYALSVSPHSFYEWDGELTAAITEASLLCDGVDIPFSLEGGRPGSAAPAPSEIQSLVDRIQVSLDEGDRIVVALDATLAAETHAELGARDTWAEIMALAEQLDAA